MTLQPSVDALEFTGERMVPEKADATNFWEHIYRYRFASNFVRNKRVLDIACGEGYGTAALLEAGARSVVGVDICAAACEHARRKYGVDARPGSVDEIPLPDRSIDVIVSFETIEHVREPETFLNECLRILAPGGTVIMSTPNEEVHREAGVDNQFHLGELTEDEFTALLAPRFTSWQLYTQRPYSAAWWSFRSFPATNPIWLRMRGAWRFFHKIREVIWSTLCPHIQGEVGEEYREQPVKITLAKDGRLSSFVNPYSVRRRARWSRECAWYTVAVAKL